MSDGERRGLPDRRRMRHSDHFVDELTTRSESPIGKMVPLSDVAPDPRQPRATMGQLDDLVASIADKGVLEPLLVRRHPDAGSGVDATYLIISGERRYRAALEAGVYDVPVIELDVDDNEALEIALIENLQRKDLTPFEEAEGYAMLADTFEYTHEQIADSVGKSRSLVTETLSLLQMPQRVRDAVNALDVTSKSVLLEVLKADDADEMIQLLERVATHGLTRKDLRRRTRSRGRSSRRKPYRFSFKAPDESYRLKLTFRRSTVDRDDLISALEEILTQLREEEAAGGG